MGLVLVLLLAEVVVVAHDMPGAGSHTVLLALVAAGVLATAAAQAARGRRSPDGEALFDAVAPGVRGATVVLYLAAALAKVNPDFLDPATSCASALAPWMGGVAPWTTIAVEAALPVGLLVGRTRAAALLAGTGFHLVLALEGNVPFTAVMLALYVAFLPAGTLVRVPAVPATPLLAGLLALWLLGAALEDAPRGDLVRDGCRAAVVALVLLGLVLARRATATPRAPVPGHPAMAVAVALVVVNAAAPYAGWKTESSFAMFSNLHTEAGRWNHALLPEAVRVLRTQDELVTVLASSDPSLVRRTRGGTRMVRAELERHLRRAPGTQATWVGDDRVPRTTVGVAAGDPVTAALDELAKWRDVRPRAGC